MSDRQQRRQSENSCFHRARELLGPCCLNRPPLPSRIPELSLEVFRGKEAIAVGTTAGTAPLTYQWSKDGVSLANGASQTFSLASTAVADAGLYVVTVSNSVGVVASQAALLTVNNPPPAFNTLLLQVTTDITNPIWTPIATNYVSGSEPRRFYRLVPQ